MGNTLIFLILILAVIGLTITVVRLLFVQDKLKKQLQEQENLCDDAIQKVKTEEKFVQNMSHEVRTPLNAVIGFSQLLALPPELVTNEEREEYMQHIQNSSNMLLMLVDDILNISAINNGEYSITIADHELNNMCNTAIASVKYRATSNIDLYYDTDIPDDYKVHTDSRRVQQILINYLTNAIKHTKEGSIILSTSLKEHPGKVTFAVTDTGTGVPKEKSEEIFKRFTMLNGTAQGTGLGLNICQVLAEKLNGEVFLDTSYTGGARFVFCIPA